MDYTKVAITNGATDQECLEAWDDILVKNSEANNNYEYQIYFKTVREYYKLISEHGLITACLLRLSMGYVPDLAEYVTSRGYKIDVNNYAESIQRAGKKVLNLNNRAKIKKNEIDSYRMEDRNIPSYSFPQMLANISFHSGLVLQDDITLAYYNELAKLVKEYNKPKEAA